MEHLVGLENNANILDNATQQEVDDLNKSLTTGGAAYSDTLPGDFTQGQVFQTESLEPTLKVVSEIEKHVILWKMMNKTKAYQLTEHFDVQTAHGGAGNAWIDESDEQPREEDAKYYRAQEIVKLMGVKKKVSHLMTQIRSGHGDVVMKETKNGVQYLLREIELALLSANGFFSVEGAGNGAFDGSVDLNALPSFNGLEKQLRAGFNDEERKAADWIGYGDDLSHSVDVDDAVMAPEDIEEACRIAMQDFGSPDKILLSPKAHSDFSRSYYPKERFNDGKGQITPGTIVPAIHTCLGLISLNSGRFLVPLQRAKAAKENSSCLDAPAGVSGSPTGSDTDLAAGDYYYVVRAVNKHGEGAAAISASVTASAGDYVDVTIEAPAVSTGILYYNVYRATSNAITEGYFIGRVKADGASNVIFCDKNLKKPGTSVAYLLQTDADTMTLKSLTPLLKIDFAIIGLFRHWAQVFYGTPIVYKPRYNVIFDNIKEKL